MGAFSVKMISYLLLALAISVVSSGPIEFRNHQFERTLGKALEERFVREKSRELLNKLITILKNAYEQGADAFNKIINDSDVKKILEGMDSLNRRVAERIINSFKELINKIDGATKDTSIVQERDLKESSTVLLKRLTQILINAYRKGSDYFNQVLNDPDVQGILNHLGPLSRKIADSMIENFKELINKIDEATKENSVVQERDLKESSTVLLKRLTQILINAYKKGSEYFNEALNDPDVQGILNHLGPLSRKIADSMIENFKELIEKLDEATKEKNVVEKRDFKESSINLLKKLIRILIKAYEKGSDAFYKVINDPDVKAILNSLDNISRKLADKLIENFKQLIIKLDEMTSDSKAKRGLIDNQTKQLKKLIQILIQASKKGSEYFLEVLSDPDVNAILEHLGTLQRKIADSIIEKFLEVFNKIDEATRENDVVQDVAFSDWKEDATVQLKRLVQILLQAYRKGAEYFDKVVNDPDVQNILEHLGPLSRKIADSIIENFRELINKIDEATREVPKSYY